MRNILSPMKMMPVQRIKKAFLIQNAKHEESHGRHYRGKMSIFGIKQNSFPNLVINCVRLMDIV